MAKTVTVYLSTHEAKVLDRLCEDFGATPYKLMRLGFQLLCRECENRLQSKKIQPDQVKEEADKRSQNPLDELVNSLSGNGEDEGESKDDEE